MHPAAAAAAVVASINYSCSLNASHKQLLFAVINCTKLNKTFLSLLLSMLLPLFFPLEYK
jgi:hypothetical protein